MIRTKKFDENISLLICSKNRETELRLLVKDLLEKLKNYKIEFVVVEETNEPNSIEGVKYVSHEVANRGIGYARNLALKHASGEIVVFLDDDCIITEGWLPHLIKPLENPKVVGVQGGVVTGPESNLVGWAETLLGFPGGGLRRILAARGENRETIEVSTLNCAYRKQAIIDCGGFDERLKLGCEDYLLAKQVCKKGKCIFAPNAIVMHEQRGSFVADFNWFVRRGRAEIALMRSRLLNHVGLMSVIRSSILIKLALISCLMSFADVYLVYLFILAILSLVIVSYIKNASLWRKSNTNILVFLVMPFVKITMDFGCDIGRIVGLFNDF
jgi:GT2 family glycosyltransferase